MQEKLKYKYTLCSEPPLHELMLLHFAPHLYYSFHHLIKWNNKAKGYKKLKAASHSEMQNVTSSTYTDGFTVNTTTQDICNTQNKNETNITTTFTTVHHKF